MIKLQDSVGETSLPTLKLRHVTKLSHSMIFIPKCVREDTHPINTRTTQELYHSIFTNSRSNLIHFTQSNIIAYTQVSYT